MRRMVTAAVLMAALCMTTGCFHMNVDAGTPARRERLDSSRVPPTRDHEHAQVELRKAYQYMRDLEHKVGKLNEDKQELKGERKKYKDLYKDYEDRYEDCMDARKKKYDDD